MTDTTIALITLYGLHLIAIGFVLAQWVVL